MKPCSDPHPTLLVLECLYQVSHTVRENPELRQHCDIKGSSNYSSNDVTIHWLCTLYIYTNSKNSELWCHCLLCMIDINKYRSPLPVWIEHMSRESSVSERCLSNGGGRLAMNRSSKRIVVGIICKSVKFSRIKCTNQ